MLSSISGLLDSGLGSIKDFGGSARDLIEFSFGSMQDILGADDGED